MSFSSIDVNSFLENNVRKVTERECSRLSILNSYPFEEKNSSPGGGGEIIS